MNDEFNLAERVLCEDDACIGLVGADGRCKVCGRLYTGKDPLPNADSAAVAPPSGFEGDDKDVDEQGMSAEVSDDSDASLWDDRVMCPDDTCIGVIGSDGTCGTCGKRA